jgi:hypothetical protein
MTATMTTVDSKCRVFKGACHPVISHHLHSSAWH